MPEFNVFGYSISFYWGMFALSVILAFGMSVFRAKRYPIPMWKAILITALLVIYGYSGAKLLHLIEYPGAPLSLSGGMSFFGSVYFIPPAIFLTSKLLRLRYGTAMDFITPYVPWALAFLRVGCFVSGCCGGRPITVFGSTFIPPVQLMECGLDILICLLVLRFEWKGRFPGLRYGAFMISYAVVRLLMEPLRDTKKDVLFLSNGQWLSILSLLIGAGVLFAGNYARRAKQKKEEKRFLARKVP